MDPNKDIAIPTMNPVDPPILSIQREREREREREIPKSLALKSVIHHRRRETVGVGTYFSKVDCIDV